MSHQRVSLRIGIAGKRGLAYLAGLRAVAGCEVTAFCDLDPAVRSQAGTEFGIACQFADYADLLEAVDAIVVATPQQLHAAQSVQALRAGLDVLSEVTPACSFAECWDLREAATAGPGRFMLAENYCYFRDHEVVRELVRRGDFGEPYFGHGDYVHELRWLLMQPDGHPTWRAKYHAGVPGNTYPTHGLGPLMHWFRAADASEQITSVTCRGAGRHTDPRFKAHDTCTMLCQLASGKLIEARYDVISNRPILGGHFMLQGTLGVFESGPTLGDPGRIWLGDGKTGVDRSWRSIQEFTHLAPEWWRHSPYAGEHAAHLGGDYFTGLAFARSALEGSPMPIGIDDALEWTAAGLCSQLSLARGGQPVAIPDFRGARPAVIDEVPSPEYPDED